MDLTQYIASINDFPEKGIVFRDITPLLENGKALHEAIDQIASFGKSLGAEVIAGPEARGFIVGTPVAYALNIGFIPVRKPGKLPRKTEKISYGLEYGEDALEVHADAIKPGQKVFVVDDLLATGGTIQATIDLIEKLGGEVVGAAFLIELKDLKGRDKVDSQNILTLLEY